MDVLHRKMASESTEHGKCAVLTDIRLRQRKYDTDRYSSRSIHLISVVGDMRQLCSRKHSHLGRLTPKNGLRIHQIRETLIFDRYSTVASQIQQLCFITPLIPNLVPIGRRKIACYEPQHPSLTPRSENGLEAMKTGCRNRSRHLGPHESNRCSQRP